ncbi:MAG: ATPase P [Polyangia bacterium]
MIRLEIPGWKRLEIAHLVLDHNGTLAGRGLLLPGVGERLERLAERVEIEVATADTFGNARRQLAGLPLELIELGPDAQSEAKREIVERLGAGSTAAIGNGRNDRLMLETAALGVALLQDEGAAREALLAADAICRDARDALDLLLDPRRLVATLRG